MRNVSLLVISIVVIILVFSVSSSSASLLMSMATLMLGGLLILLFGKNENERHEMASALLVSFIVVTLATILQYQNYINEFSSFSDMRNDNYRFYIVSHEGSTAASLHKIFEECIIHNVHYENGGYYFYIKAIAFLSSKYADGNHLLLQQLGTALPCIISSVVVFSILSKYCPIRKAMGYTCLFITLTPLIFHSVGIHRDAMIAFFYFVLIYLWLCKDFSWRIGLLQVGIAFVLFYFREQHGLFASSFIVVSAISTRKQNRFVNIVAVAVLAVIVGASYIYELMYTNWEETNEFYSNLGAESVSGLDSGIGRYVSMLPFPLKQIAKIFFLQLRFPPWLNLSESRNVYSFAIGVLSFIISVYWFYVFSQTVVCLIKEGIKKLPSKMINGLALLIVFLFLNTSNLDSRRVVCMYLLLFVAYVYYQEYILSKKKILSFRRGYSIIYVGLCMLYLLMKVSIG